MPLLSQPAFHKETEMYSWDFFNDLKNPLSVDNGYNTDVGLVTEKADYRKKHANLLCKI